MILNYVSGIYTSSDLIIVALIMVFAFVFHNFFQSFIASRLGDQGPKYSGYMSFDMQRQLEPIGVAFLFLLGFGWPRAIPTNSRNYKNRGKQEMWVWYAGPLAYLLVAFVCTLAAALVASMGSPGAQNLARSLIFASSTAILHAVINLFPLYPLDGAKAALAWGNPDVRRFVQQMASYGPIGFLVFFMLLSFLRVTESLMVLFQGILAAIISLIPGL